MRRSTADETVAIDRRRGIAGVGGSRGVLSGGDGAAQGDGLCGRSSLRRMRIGSGRRPSGRPRGRDFMGWARSSRSCKWTPRGRRRLHRRIASDEQPTLGLRAERGAELPAGREPHGTGVTFAHRWTDVTGATSLERCDRRAYSDGRRGSDAASNADARRTDSRLRDAGGGWRMGRPTSQASTGRPRK